MLLVSWVGARGARGAAAWWVGGPLGIHSDLRTGAILLPAPLLPPSPAVAQGVEVVESLAAGVAELGAGARVHVVVPRIQHNMCQ